MYRHNRPSQKTLILPILSVALSSFMLASCSNNNDDTGVAVVDTEQLVSETLYTVQITDAVGKPVDATVTVVEGSDANNIIPEAQESQSAIADTGSIVTFEPTEFSSDEETIYVNAAADNYLSNTVPVTITKGGTGNQSIVIIKIPESGVSSTPVEGIGATAVEDMNIEDAPIVVNAETTSSDAADPGETTITTSVTIPQSVQATDAQGEPLSNNLSVVVAQFDPDESTALQSFPGGFTANITNANEIDAPSNDDSNGEIESTGDLIFQSVGFTAIEVKDDAGKQAKSFDPATPVTVRSEIQAGTKHPTATPTRNLEAGDKVPLWSYESSTGQWTYEREVTIQIDENNQLYTEYEVTHLSWYNLDYFESAGCRVSTLTVNDTDGQPYSESLTGYVQGVDGQWIHDLKYVGDGAVNVLNAPGSFDVTITLFHTDGTPADISTTGPFNLCNNGSQQVGQNTISVTPLPEATLSELAVNVSSYCSNDATVAAKPVGNLKVTLLRMPLFQFVNQVSTSSTGAASFTVADGEYGVKVRNSSTGQDTIEEITISGANSAVDISIPQECEIVPVTTGGSTTTDG